MGGKCDLLALTKDVLFSGNMVGGVVIGQSDDGFPVVENGIANAIDMNGSLFSSLYTPNLTLAAEEGSSSAANSTREKIRILPPAGTTTSARIPPSMAASSCWNTMLSSAGILRK
ncbi:hypothetical protein M5E88_16945 [Akkermansia muciniphila]|nr:hypothetical protein M5E88_16945 [Akkermansia muciniphila]